MKSGKSRTIAGNSTSNRIADLRKRSVESGHFEGGIRGWGTVALHGHEPRGRELVCVGSDGHAERDAQLVAYRARPLLLQAQLVLLALNSEL